MGATLAADYGNYYYWGETATKETYAPNNYKFFAFMDLTHNIIEYINCCIGAFASRFKLPRIQAYNYLSRFNAIDFLINCYSAEHTLSIDDAVDDITQICQKNGGKLGC